MNQRFTRLFAVQWAILTVAMAVLGTLTAFNLYSGFTRTEEREYGRLLTQVRVIGENLGSQLKSTDNVLTSIRDELAAAPDGGKHSPDYSDHLIRLERALPGVRTLLVLDAAGEVRLANRPELIGRNFAQREYFDRPRRNSDPNILFVSPPFKTVLGVWAISLTRVRTDGKGGFAGVVTATLDPAYFTTLLNSVRYADDLRGTVIHGEGSVFQMAPPVPQVLGKNVAQPGSFFSRHLASGRIESIFAGRTTAADEDRQLAMRSIQPRGLLMDKPLVAVASRDRDAIFGLWRNDAIVYGGIFVVAALLSSLTLARIQKRQRRQLEKLDQADVELRNSEERFRALFQSSADVILLHPLFGADGNLGRFVEANTAACERLGYSRDELLTMTPLDLDEVRTYPSPADLAAFQRHAIEARSLMFERVHVAKDGHRIPVEVSSHVFELKGETMMLSIVRDITERKAAEEALRNNERKLQMMLDNAADAVFIAGPDERWVYVNDRAAALVACGRDELVGKPIYDIVPPTSRDLYRQEFARLRSSNETWIRELRLVRKDGSRRPVEMNAVHLPDGTVYGSCRDITERKRAEENQRIAAIAFETHEGMLVTDKAGTILRVNHAFTRLTGYSAEESIGRTPAMLQSGRQDSGFYRQLWQDLLRDGHWEGEVWNRRKSGEIYPEWLTITAVARADGKITHYVAVFSDITERKAAEAQIHSLAFYDPLTNLPNRRLLYDRCEQALRACARRRNHGAILFLDLDRFKTLNDTKGHDIGDLLLIEVARRLLASVRAEDTVARMGGDEFVVMLEELSPAKDVAREQARDVAEKIRAAIDAPYSLNGHAHESSPSIGVRIFDSTDGSVNELLMHADKAMYQAKTAGRNTVRIFDADAQDTAPQ